MSVAVNLREFIILGLTFIAIGLSLGYVLWFDSEPDWYLDFGGGGGAEFPPPEPKPLVPDSPADIDWTFKTRVGVG